MPDSNEFKFDRLRELAEDLLKQNGNTHDPSSGEMTRLLHELRVHQIELNIQNEELQRAQGELTTSKQAYTDLFDYAPIAYFVIDENGLIQQANLTAVAQFATTRQALQGTPLAHLVARDERDKYYQHHRALIDDLRPGKLEVWFESGHSEPFFGQMETVVVDDDAEAPIFRVAIIDITERKLYEQHLEAIHQLDQVIVSRSPLSTVIETAIEQLWQRTACDYISIIVFGNRDHQTHYFIRDNSDEAVQRYGKLRQLKGDMPTANDMATWQDAPTRIIHHPNFLAHGTGGRYPVHLFALLSNDDEPRGLIDMGARSADSFDDVPTDFIQQLAVQLGIAVQQADYLEQIHRYTVELEEMVDERTKELRESQANEHEQRLFAEGLLTIVRKINRSLNLEHVLEQILINLENIVKYDGAQIIISDSDSSEVILQSRGSLQLPAHATQSSIVFDNYPVYLKMARSGEPAIISEEAYRYLCDDEPTEPVIESYLGTPIRSGQHLLGFINLYGSEAAAFSQNDMVHLQAFAEQASVAVKNARLYKKGQELAALEERQRLARDLHDAVSQLVFSLSIMSESLPNLLQKERFERAKDIADTMRRIAASAHAEMRLLLLELRPMSFESTGLDELLQQLIIAFLGRHSALATHIQAEETPSLSIDVKNNLYRIAQEALNNIGKHADAHNIEIKLWVEDEAVNLTIEDDGQGFNINQPSNGHGTRIMRERAESIGAEYEIASQVDQGTRIYVRYKISG